MSLIKSENSQEAGTPSVFRTLLAQEAAPKGPVESDLKTAVYLCACLKHYTFEEAVVRQNTVLLGFLMVAMGYKGNTDIDANVYLKLVQELVEEGAIEHIGSGAGFVCPAFKRESVGKVDCYKVSLYYSYSRPRNSFSFNKPELRFVDETGEYPLFSKYLVIPGDEVKVVINLITNCAYVQKITKLRKMLVGEKTKNSVLFRDSNLSPYDIHIDQDELLASPVSSRLAVVEIYDRQDPNKLFTRIREILDEDNLLDRFIYKAIFEHQLPSSWPESVKHSAKKIPKLVKPEEMQGRVDLRELPLVTIDGADARDFDDAVYCEKHEDGYRLYVAIADVSYYVRKGSAINQEALNRTTSVYFPYFVIPMLPEVLSNGICSLNPKVERLCMVCDMRIDFEGQIKSYKFYPAVMESHARLTYDEAYHMIETGQAYKEEHQLCVPWVQNLYGLYQALKKARDIRGAFEFESTEVQFLFDEKMNIRALQPDNRNEAHMLIEECMIAANICAATFIRENNYEGLYRVHARPNDIKLAKLRALLSRYGLDLPGGESPSPQDYKSLVSQLEAVSPQLRQILSLQLLRSMTKAEYSPKNIGHFGLALDNYTHFTSPIRRYPDLVVHRIIKHILEKQEPRSWGKIGSQRYSKEELNNFGTVCSAGEIRAADAEFDVDNSLKCAYVANFINYDVMGTISTISSFGVYITLNDFYIDGMLARSVVGKIGTENVATKGANAKNNGQSELGLTVQIAPSTTSYNYSTFHLGDQIKVRISSVNPSARQIELLPAFNSKKAGTKTEQLSEKLASGAVEKVEVDNQDKVDLLERIGDISTPQDAKGVDFTSMIRSSVNYSIDADLSSSEAKCRKLKKAKLKALHREKVSQQQEEALKQGMSLSEFKAAKASSKPVRKKKAAPAPEPVVVESETLGESKKAKKAESVAETATTPSVIESVDAKPKARKSKAKVAEAESVESSATAETKPKARKTKATTSEAERAVSTEAIIDAKPKKATKATKAKAKEAEAVADDSAAKPKRSRKA